MIYANRDDKTLKINRSQLSSLNHLSEARLWNYCNVQEGLKGSQKDQIHRVPEKWIQNHIYKGKIDRHTKRVLFNLQSQKNSSWDDKEAEGYKSQ